MLKPWTPQELEQEWQYVYDERLAILGCYGRPTPEQDKLARTDADQALERIKQQEP